MEKVAVIIGSGVAGTFVATQILKRSLFDKVIMLEAGSEYQMGDYSQWLDYMSGGNAPYEESYDTENDYESKGIQPWYINGVVEISTNKSSIDLLEFILNIEEFFGRVREKRNEARIM